MSLQGIDWGTSSDWYKREISEEFEDKNIYRKYYDVEEGDIVLDLGTSIGPFPYSIKDKKPKHVFCVEPSAEQLPTLTKNLEGIPSTVIPYGLGSNDDVEEFEVFGRENQLTTAPSISFQTLLSKYNIEQIDFLKTDCEGGEYNFFNNENIWWIKNNVKKIVGEWHLRTPKNKQKFKVFRDTYLRLFPNHQVHAVCTTDIKWELWNDNFIDYYKEVIIYIDNTK